MIILDTNVISEVARPVPGPAVVAWLDAQALTEVWTTAITVFETRFGLALMSASRRQHALRASLDHVYGVVLGNRVLDFDTSAADATVVIAARCQSVGRTMDIRDAMIAGTVASRGATLATRDVRHFADAGIPLVDPWAVTP